VLVVTLPDNPTGTVAGAELLREIAQIAEEHDLFVVSEEIYRDLAFVRRRHPGERGSRRARAVSVEPGNPLFRTRRST